jgi:hypothetical protein
MIASSRLLRTYQGQWPENHGQQQKAERQFQWCVVHPSIYGLLRSEQWGLLTSIAELIVHETWSFL